MKIFLPFCLLLMGSLGLRAQNDLREESIYFLMTSRFFDGDTSNNRPTEWCSWFPGNPNNSNYSGQEDVTWKGDFKGLIQQLDYIQSMGFTAIWITPVVHNRSPLDYHGYHAWDFTRVDPRLESPGYTFKNLIDSCHARGMKIFLDVVLNHAGRYGIRDRAEIKYNTDPTQSWGKDRFGQPLQNNPNWAYDGLTPNPDDNKIWSRANLAAMPPPYNQNLSAYNWPGTENYVNTSDPAWYHHSGNGFAQGYDDTTNLFYRALAGDTPDLFTGGDSVRNYLFQAYKTFIDMGIDGMRLDAIKHLPKRDVFYFVDRFRQINPHLMVFGEVAQLRHELHPVEEINPHWYTWRGAVKNSPHSGVAVIDFYALGTFHLFGKGEPFSQVKNAARYDDLYADPGTNVVFLDNHDFGPNNDWNRRFDGSAQSLAAALNFIFLWRGVPCVYYGTEVQFKKGFRCDISGSNALNTSIDNTGRAYFGNEIDQAPNHPIYKHLRKLNALRKAVPALQKGSWRWDGTDNPNGVGFVRQYQNSEVAVGLAKDGQVTFHFNGLTNGTYRDAVTGNALEVTDGSLSFTVSPSSAGVYILNGPGLIGQLGDGFFQNSSSGGGGIPSQVTFQPLNPLPGTSFTITYTGNLASGNQVIMHYSFDNWTVGGIQDMNMTRSGNRWQASVTVPVNARINFTAAFHNGSGTWDNNGGADYKTSLGSNADMKGPEVQVLSPPLGSTWIPLDARLILTFDEPVKKGRGFISIYQGQTLIYNIDINSSMVTFSDREVIIRHNGLPASALLHVLIPYGAVLDTNENSFLGFQSNSQWVFSTASANALEEMDTDIRIFPNPSTGTFALAAGRDTPLVQRILNAQGQEIHFEIDYQGNTARIRPGKFSSGIYLIEFTYLGQVYRRKILLQP